MDPFWTPTLEDLKKYFTDEEWSKLTDYDKKNYTNIMENFNIMNDLDMNPEEPDFVKAWRIRNTSIVSSTKMDIVEENIEVNKKVDKITPTERDVKPTSDINIIHRSITEKKKGTGKKMLNATAGSGLFTPQEILESVRLDNTVGALYEYCLSELFQESCDMENNIIASTSSEEENKVDKKQSTNADSILKYIANIESKREKLSEDHKHIYCKQCQRFYDFFCPIGHRIPVGSLPDNIEGTASQYPEYLAIGRSAIPEAGVGIWSTAAIQKGVVWGPFKDTIIPEVSDNERERDKINEAHPI
ncbi:unnamed protein product [Nezara viridula]|uniref:KRAB-related domain-containing protein n=1 Tax=Nezara viridula TaxID=85310 RepID=A0A9P0E1X4_NEZVI|nr:unnamed protein product [Nezara viridula]